ncbi:hexosaminidase [Brachybacterium muris]|uniref:beta-N-acetylhexosaminidase n=1 Tax=Brachybacterium muris TaxID=219301 RepID=UPI0019585EB2|nr:family 20 glycosylhydrolase [Brachybacterium muris]MBM7501925.1 hexosaminidase [Brachybacterium muris]MCT1432006.1 beta-N-acetylhexosaminidase [Brachybacterium muris]MCT2176698.1 beta-N-acetylhexosaminidase [Brachybacterium muris]MCT2295174.1 beta-N-acetylhexosaminidase [Brachybacterium muris]
MPDPLALVPLPQSVIYSHGVWETTDPWAGLSIGISEDLPRTEYTLSISPAGANLSAGSEAALADGRNTFAQIVAGSGGSIPCVSIVDSPKYAWRGMHLDVSRHFFTVQEVETMIDAMALHRLNVLHLHLTDDQGWRVEIKGYPKLTEVGAWRDQSLVGHMGEDEASWTYDGVRHGGFYTQDDLRGLVEYGQKRGVMIVPEVDLPGHMQAVVASYPELGNNPSQQIGVREVWGISDHVLGVSDQVFEFLRDVLTQVADIFPAPFFHIGGDECPRVEWERSTEARARMTEWGYTRVSEIQGRFTQFAYDVLTEKGKRVIGWDEVLETHLPDDMVIMNWRHGNGVKTSTERGFQTVIANNEHLYFDHYQAKSEGEPLAIGGHTSIKDVYTADYSPKKLTEDEQKLVIGMQGQLWTEYIPTLEHLQYMAFPRMCAVAERAWGSPEQSWEEFEERLRGHLPRLDAFGIRYRPLD